MLDKRVCLQLSGMLLRPSYVEVVAFSSCAKERGSCAKAAREGLFLGEGISDNTHIRIDKPFMHDGPHDSKMSRSVEATLAPGSCFVYFSGRPALVYQTSWISGVVFLG